MAAEAFGSPVVFNALGTSVVATERRSVGERLAHVVRGRLFQEEDHLPINRASQAANGMVQLLRDDGTVVGVGTVDKDFTCGIELHQVKLRPFEIAVHVTHVVEKTEWVGEVVGRLLGDCLGKVIRWRRSFIRWAHPSEVRTTSSPLREEPNFSFPPIPTPQFDFHDVEENASNSNVTSPIPSERSTSGRSFLLTQGSEANTSNVLRVDGMPIDTPRRRYSMTNRRAKERNPRERGESASQKVTLGSVLCVKEKGACKRNCLRDVDAKYVLDQRYMAWGQKYEARSTWIMQMLNAFYTRTEGQTRDKYVTKLDGVVVCNACYAAALGYSQRCFKQLKTAHVVYGKVAAIHGNTCQGRESAKMSAARESLDVFVKEAGEQQPHRSVRRKMDNKVLPLILLSMNTTKLDVFRYVNEEVKKLVDGSELSMSSFRRLWRKEFPHVQIPPYSRFSKCYHCWEYKCGMESTTNAAAKGKIKELFILHIRIQMEERRDYWLFKRSAIITPDIFMCLIVDGMDQNTTMIPKMRQTVKNIESRFVKTHLCGILVHGIGFYADVWIDAHHKHDSNQVITSIMNVMCDVKRRKGSLSPTLRIQADNTTRENKNIYMFAMCVTLVGLGLFKEVRLCFLIVGHTHEDIDQRFSVISNVLKRKDIDTLEEMLELVEKGTSYTEAFVSARKLENVRNWKAFITPHLLQGGEQLTGITFSQHMRFYVEDGLVRVQHKHFSSDEWGPTRGHLCLNSLLNVAKKPELAEVFAANRRELKALDEFIAYKKKLVLRGSDPIKNMEVADKISKFKDYLEDFPQSNREGVRDLPFWPSDILNENEDDNIVSNGEEEGPNSSVGANAVDNRIDSGVIERIMSTMPNPKRRGYFGPRKDRPPQEGSRRATGGRSKGKRNELAPEIVRDANEDPFPPFNPENDVIVGQFVALTVELREIKGGVPFYVGKVLEFGQGKWALKMEILWYRPTMRPGAEEEVGSNRVRYTNCIESTWEPSGERFAWIEKEAAIYSWMDVPPRGRSGHAQGSNITVHGVQTEETVIIPVEAKPHLLEYLAMQMEDLDDERLRTDLNMY